MLVLRNFGIFIIAETIEEAFYLTYNVMSAIEAQVGLVTYTFTLLHMPISLLLAQLYNFVIAPVFNSDLLTV